MDVFESLEKVQRQNPFFPLPRSKTLPSPWRLRPNFLPFLLLLLLFSSSLYLLNPRFDLGFFLIPFRVSLSSFSSLSLFSFWSHPALSEKDLSTLCLSNLVSWLPLLLLLIVSFVYLSRSVFSISRSLDFCWILNPVSLFQCCDYSD